jgi:hypothetical protein
MKTIGDKKKERDNMKKIKWIEREYLPIPRDQDRYTMELEVPVGAEFVGVQHNARMLVMLLHGNNTLPYKNERRTVIRVKDGELVDKEGTRYIGSDGMWHLFEIL